MYKMVEQTYVHKGDDDESLEDYGAADVQVNVLHRRAVDC
jgi:hypothetical protein